MIAKNQLSESIIRDAVHEFADDGEVELLEETEKSIEYFDEENDYKRIYYYPEKINREHIKSILIADEKVKKHICIDKLIDFIVTEIDKNALCVCRNIALIWEEYDLDVESEVRKRLYAETYDEYAFEICDDKLGTTWIERQIVVINVSEIKAVSDEFHDDLCHRDFCLGVLSTLFHEFRHLVYECNEILEIDTDQYPWGGGREENVEEYGNTKAEDTYGKYEDMFMPVKKIA